MFDPSIGKETLTKLDVLGVLIGHLLFGIGATILIDWNWIPMTEEEKARGKSLSEIKKSWDWE